MTPESKRNKLQARRRREKEARAELIRTAAVRVFARHGYDHSTLDMVADEAELGRTSLYYYFPTKKALFAHIVEQAIEELKGLMAENMTGWGEEGGDTVAVVNVHLKATLEYFRANRDSLQLILHLIALSPERFNELLDDTAAADVFRIHQPPGDARDGSPGALSEGRPLVGLISSLLLGFGIKVLRGDDRDVEAEAQKFLDLLRCSPDSNNKKSEV